MWYDSVISRAMKKRRNIYIFVHLNYDYQNLF